MTSKNYICTLDDMFRNNCHPLIYQRVSRSFWETWGHSFDLHRIRFNIRIWRIFRYALL